MSEQAHPESDPRSGAESGAPRTVYFDATLAPHRSLSRRGFLIVMTAIGTGGFLIGFGFFLAGAWPVAGFAGLEILLVYIAFKLNFRESRRREHLRLSRPGGLEIERVAPDGARSAARLEPTWLRVEMDDPPQHHSQLRLLSHGRAVVVGGFLTADERAELARALRDALAAYRRGPADAAAPAPGGPA